MPSSMRRPAARQLRAVPVIRRRRGDLDVETKLDHIAVAHGVVLALQAQLAGLLGALLALVGDEIVVRGYLGTDESALEIGVDHARRLRRGGARRYRPGAHFLRAGGEIGLQAEQQ